MLIRLLVVILIGDGLMTLAWGRGFLIWQRRVAPNWYRPVLDRLIDWPELLIRLAAAGEVILAGQWLIRRQHEMPSDLGAIRTETRGWRK